jgi:hypothetical protein
MGEVNAQNVNILWHFMIYFPFFLFFQHEENVAIVKQKSVLPIPF